MIVTATLSSEQVIDVLAAELMQSSLATTNSNDNSEATKPKYTSKVSKKKTKAVRSCKKCGEPGHNAKTCKDNVKAGKLETGELSAELHLKAKRMVEAGVSFHELKTAFPKIAVSILKDVYDRYDSVEQ